MIIDVDGQRRRCLQQTTGQQQSRSCTVPLDATPDGVAVHDHAAILR
jgi:hypothetical protein